MFNSMYCKTNHLTEDGIFDPEYFTEQDAYRIQSTFVPKDVGVFYIIAILKKYYADKLIFVTTENQEVKEHGFNTSMFHMFSITKLNGLEGI